MSSIYRITPPPVSLRAEVRLPASKSVSNRALVLNALSDGCDDKLENLSDSDDTAVMISAFESLSANRRKPIVIDVGAAGTSMRFLTAYLSTREGVDCLLTGSERMRHRPIATLVDALRDLGADIRYEGEDGFAPLRIQGKRLLGGEVKLDGGVSSQFISALLMIGACMPRGLRLTLLGDVISRPYIDMTLSMMRQWGVQSVVEGDVIHVPHQSYVPCRYRVEGDWSSASYWLQARALWNHQHGADDARVTLLGLNEPSIQGDSHVAEVLERLSTGEKLHVNLVNMPDMAQTIVVAACLMRVPFHIEGLQSLHIKETDRVEALRRETAKMGFRIEETEYGTIEFDGHRTDVNLDDVIIDTYEDHRMALSFAAACITEGRIVIRHPDVVSKSYPSFWEDLRKAGFTIEG